VCILLIEEFICWGRVSVRLVLMVNIMKVRCSFYFGLICVRFVLIGVVMVIVMILLSSICELVVIRLRVCGCMWGIVVVCVRLYVLFVMRCLNVVGYSVKVFLFLVMVFVII